MLHLAIKRLNGGQSYCIILYRRVKFAHILPELIDRFKNVGSPLFISTATSTLMSSCKIQNELLAMCNPLFLLCVVFFSNWYTA